LIVPSNKVLAILSSRQPYPDIKFGPFAGIVVELPAIRNLLMRRVQATFALRFPFGVIRRWRTLSMIG
jgi:hypothetical protein